MPSVFVQNMKLKHRVDTDMSLIPAHQFLVHSFIQYLSEPLSTLDIVKESMDMGSELLDGSS